MYHFLMFIFERERERVSGGGADRRETQNLKQVPASELSAQSPMRAQTHELGDHDLSQSQALN